MDYFSDINPQDIDPETGRPYPNYSSPALEAYCVDCGEPEDASCLHRGLCVSCRHDRMLEKEEMYE